MKFYTIFNMNMHINNIFLHILIYYIINKISIFNLNENNNKDK